MKKRKSIICALLLVSILAGCTMIYVNPSYLSFDWETESVFERPETVLLDRERNCLYVSNINGGINKKDNNGFISRLSLNGKVIDLVFIDGLNAPKGMCIYNDVLYIVDVNEIVMFDLKKEVFIKKLEVEHAIFLNDIAPDDKGLFYITDTEANLIFVFDGLSSKIFFESKELKGLGGIDFKNNKLTVGMTDQLFVLDIKNKQITSRIDRDGKVDGLFKISDRTYLASNFFGKIQYVRKDEQITILNRKWLLNNTANFFYDSEAQKIYVPTFFKGTVASYSLLKQEQ